MADLTLPTNFRPTLPPRSKRQALKEGLLNAPFYAATWPLMVTDIAESGLDALRGTRSPNRMTQAASALKQMFGGDPIPQEYERGVEDWDTTKYDVAGSLPAFSVNPLRAIRDIPAALKHGARSFALAQSPARVVKPKGGNYWLAGSVEDALRGLKRGPVASEMQVAGTNRYGEPYYAIENTPTGRRVFSPDEYASAVELEKQVGPINQWIEGPLTKYVKTRMASPEDEVRKLAEQGILHYQPRGGFEKDLYKKRVQAGFPDVGLAKTELGGMWEDVADSAIIPGTFRYFDTSPINFNAPDAAAKQAAALRKIGGDFAAQNPDAVAYKANIRNGVFSRDAGFSHLVDELSNALNPASGLPRHLQLSPEAMQHLSMEKAVRRVDEINKWRAEQIAKAKLGRMAGRPVIREYAENNPKGLRWVQLNREGDFAAESDAMGHSVRGYEPIELGGSQFYGQGGWDAIKSGKAKIYSLQDAKGEPHVTVEVATPSLSEHINTQIKVDRIKELLGERYQEYLYKKGFPKYSPNTALEVLEKEYPDVYAQYMSELPRQADRITQIKGKQNRAPNEEYLPFVQDFVRNSPLGGQWSEVGDLQNTGLHKLPDNRFITKAQLDEGIQRLTNEGDPTVNAEWFMRQIRNDPKWWENAKGAFENFASGGSVSAQPALSWPF